MFPIKNTSSFWLNLVFCFFLSLAWSEVWADDHGDNPNTATQLYKEDTSFSGAINGTRTNPDLDYFKITLASSGTVSISFSSQNVFLNLSNDLNKYHSASSFSYQLSSGDYYIAVLTDNNVTSVADYNVNISCPTCSPKPIKKYAINLYVEGEGTVVSNPAGINCGEECIADYEEGTTVTLTANPKSGYKLSEWYVEDNSCPTGSNICQILMNRYKAVSATFEKDDSQGSLGLTLTGETDITLAPFETAELRWKATGANSYTAGVTPRTYVSLDLSQQSNTLDEGVIKIAPKTDDIGKQKFTFKVCNKQDQTVCSTKDFTVTVAYPKPPEVSGFAPTTATHKQLTTFTITGDFLTDTVTASVGNCGGLEFVSRAKTQQTFTCTPNATGSQPYKVENTDSGKVLKQGNVTVSADNSNELARLKAQRDQIQQDIANKKSSLQALETEANDVPNQSDIDQAEKALYEESEDQLETFHASAPTEVIADDTVWEDGSYKTVTIDGVEAYAYSPIYEKIIGRIKYLIAPHTIYVVYGTKDAKDSQEGKNYPALVWTEYHETIMAGGKPLTTPRFIVNNYAELKETVTDLKSFTTGTFLIRGVDTACKVPSGLVGIVMCAYYEHDKENLDKALQLTFEQIRNEMEFLSAEEKEKAIRFVTSIALDLTPYAGSIKSAGQFVIGEDLITREDTNRIIELVGIIPYTKAAIKYKRFGVAAKHVDHLVVTFLLNYKVAKNTDYISTLWKLKPTNRGDELHKIFGENLPAGFLTIDKIDRAKRIVTSIKSIDPSLPSYSGSKISGYRGKIKKDLEALIDFKGHTRTDQSGLVGEKGKIHKVIPEDYDTKIFEIIIRKDVSTPEHFKIVEEMKEIAKGSKIIFIEKYL